MQSSAIIFPLKQTVFQPKLLLKTPCDRRDVKNEFSHKSNKEEEIVCYMKHSLTFPPKEIFKICAPSMLFPHFYVIAFLAVKMHAFPSIAL